MEQWQEIRGGIEKNLGRRVWMRSHRGRSKCVENVGILERSFPSVFTILIEEHGQEKRISYGYNELFTRQLEMEVFQCWGKMFARGQKGLLGDTSIKKYV